MKAPTTKSAFRKWREARLAARADRKARLSDSVRGRGGRLYSSRAARHAGLNVEALQRNRAKAKAGRRSRRINRMRAKR